VSVPRSPCFRFNTCGCSGEAATLVAQRAELEEERAKFTDAAIRLARERSEFEVRPCLSLDPCLRLEHIIGLGHHPEFASVFIVLDLAVPKFDRAFARTQT
jgi:hypothetical protein